MRIPQDIVRQRMQDFEQACRNLHVKLTHQRMVIYRELASTEEHPDAETIHKRVRRHIPTVSLDTVYRNLKLLAEHGLVSVVGMSHERLRFDANLARHHHFVCIECGKIRDFESEHPRLDSVAEDARAFGEPLALRVEVKGVCSDCSAK